MKHIFFLAALSLTLLAWGQNQKPVGNTYSSSDSEPSEDDPSQDDDDDDLLEDGEQVIIMEDDIEPEDSDSIENPQL